MLCRSSGNAHDSNDAQGNINVNAEEGMTEGTREQLTAVLYTILIELSMSPAAKP